MMVGLSLERVKVATGIGGCGDASDRTGQDRNDKMTIILAGGDVFNGLPNDRHVFRWLTPLLQTADIVFGNCEGIYFDGTARAPNAKSYHAAPVEQGLMLGEAPFHVMSMAGNHIMDGGMAGLESTLSILRAQAIATTGAGPNLASALRPAIVERGGRRVAFVAFCSVFPVGHEARIDRGGLAPLRIHTHYGNPDPNFWDPGNDPLVTTQVDEVDLANFEKAIELARNDADNVIVSCHWGHSTIGRNKLVKPRFQMGERIWLEDIADYERALAHLAIDLGADAILCHHQLNLRGVGFHRGRPIFYGLGMLVQHFIEPHLHVLFDASPDYPYMPLPADHRNTGIAVLDIQDKEVRAGFIPAVIEPDGSTRPLLAGDPAVELAKAHLLGRTALIKGLDTVLTLDEWKEWAIFWLERFPADVSQGGFTRGR